MIRKRIRFRAPYPCYEAQDQVHDAFVHAFILLGATPEQVIGADAEDWNFGIDCIEGPARHIRRIRSVIVSSASPALARLIVRMQPGHIQRRPENGRVIDFSAGLPSFEPAPLVPGCEALPVVMISPLVISRQGGDGSAIRQHQSLAGVDLSAALSSSLSRAVKREVQLEVMPDDFYIAARNGDVARSYPVKHIDGKASCVVGFKIPLVLLGSPEDLAAAWYAGLGAKRRMGFGCIGAVR
mgnify:FL=1